MSDIAVLPLSAPKLDEGLVPRLPHPKAVRLLAAQFGSSCDAGRATAECRLLARPAVHLSFSNGGIVPNTALHVAFTALRERQLMGTRSDWPNDRDEGAKLSLTRQISCTLRHPLRWNGIGLQQGKTINFRAG